MELVATLEQPTWFRFVMCAIAPSGKEGNYSRIFRIVFEVSSYEPAKLQGKPVPNGEQRPQQSASLS